MITLSLIPLSCAYCISYYVLPGGVCAGAIADDFDVAGSVTGAEEVDLGRGHQRSNLLRQVERFRFQVLKQIQLYKLFGKLGFIGLI